MRNQNLTEKIMFLMSKEDVQKIDSIAEEKYISRGQLIRDALRDVIKNHEVNE